MNDPEKQPPKASRWTKPIAVLAVVFGGMTILSGGSVLFGADETRELAGNYVAFVVWFNFLAGFFYVAAGIGIWLNRPWATGLAWGIAGATALAALIFAILVTRGAQFEMRTVGALALRFSLWTAIVMALSLKERKA